MRGKHFRLLLTVAFILGDLSGSTSGRLRVCKGHIGLEPIASSNGVYMVRGDPRA